MRCEHYQNLMLDHLYGLLDAAEAEAVETHLTGCADCTTARDAATLAQGLIARAAKVSFPAVRFVPPELAQTVPIEVPAERKAGSAVHPIPNGRERPARPVRRTLAAVPWGRWAVAASLLFLIPLTVLPVSGWASKLDSARSTAGRAATEYADAKSAFARLEAQTEYAKQLRERALAQADKRHADALSALVAEEEAALKQRASLDINRPVSVQPGAPNEFRVHVRNAGRGLVEADIRDQDGRVIHRQRIEGESKDGHPVRLPAEVWTRVKPETELFLTVTTTDANGQRTEVQDKVRLFGPVYTTLLVTDRPLYRPGERLFFRSLTLDRVSFRPPTREQHLKFELRDADNKPVPGLSVVGSTEPVRVIDGVVEPVPGPDGQPVRGVGCGAFLLPDGLPDGDYVLTLTEQPHPAKYAPTVPAPVRKVIRVRSGAQERYQKKIGFAAAAYSPGDTVEAWCELKQQDKPVAGVSVLAKVYADHRILPAQVVPATTFKDGRAKVSFVLPPDLTRGDVRLKVTFVTDPKTGVGETVTERVPVVGRSLVVEFFPEGGELIAGVPSRVYVRATTPDGQPVDLRGTITDGKQALARVETLSDPREPGVNRGLGAFTFTPKLGVPYWLNLEHPAAFAAPLDGPLSALAGIAGSLGVRTGFQLPKVQAEGVALTTPDAVTAPGQPVRVTLHSVDRPRNLVVGAYTRGRLADTQRVAAAPGKPVEVKLMGGNDPRGGVTRVTVFEDPNPNPADPKLDLIPVAERLVFRKPGEALNIAYTAKPGDGGAVDLAIAATDEKGQPTAAIVWASVVNAANVTGPRDRLMPTHFLLAGETQTPDALEHADFLLTDHPRAAECLDLVLATQGWRRFVEQKAVAPQELAATPDAARLIAMNGQRPLGFESSLTREQRRIEEAHWPRIEAAQRDLDAAKKAASAPHDPRPTAEALRILGERGVALAAAREAVTASEEPVTTFRVWVWYAVGGLIAVAVALSAVACVRPNGLGGVLPLAIGAAAALGLGTYLGMAGSPETKRVAPGDVANQMPVKSADPGPKGAAVPEAKIEDATPAPPNPVREGPKAMGVMPEAAGKDLGPAARLPGLGEPFPDAMLKVKEPFNMKAVRGVVRQNMASDAAEDPARLAVQLAADARAKSVTDKLSEVIDGAPKLDPAAVVRVWSLVPRVAPLVVREYAAPRPGSQPDVPESDTVLWQPLIVLPTDGKTTVSFHTGTGAGGYQVMIAGHTPDGRIGAVRGLLPVAPQPTK